MPINTPSAGVKKPAVPGLPSPGGEKGSMLRGDLAIMPFREIAAWVESSGKTGSLTLFSGKGEKTLGLVQGRLVALLSDRKEESLEEMLAQSASLSETKIRQACQDSRRQGVQLPLYLVEKKLIDQTRLEDLLARRLVKALADILQWEGADFTFTPDVPAGTPANRTGLEFGCAVAAAERMIREALFQKISQDLLNGNFDIPPVPKTVFTIQEALREKGGSVHDVLKVITADQVLTSKILKVANSSFYSFVNPVKSLQHAIVLVGLKPLISIATAHSLMGTSEPAMKAISRFMVYSFKCAYAAKRIASMVGVDEEVAFVCGLLHDIGKTVLYNMVTCEEPGEGPREKLVEAYHTQAGVLLAAKWNLPEEVIEVIEHHGNPARLTPCSPTVEIVHVASRLVNEVGILPPLRDLGLGIDLSPVNVDQVFEELDQVGAFIEKIF